MSRSITVVVATYERPAPLGRCLAALAAQTLERDEYQVVVVDDGSTCDLEALLEPYRSQIRLKLLHEAHAGPAAARNRGIRSADGELIALTDDDCEPRADWLERVRDRLVAEGEFCMVGGHVVNLLTDNPFSEASQLILDMVYEHFNHDPDNAHFFVSMNAGFSRHVLIACGAFDPDFRTAEDRDLCDRWRSSGYRLVYEPNALIGHAHELNFRSFCCQHYGYGKGAAHYHRARQERSSGSMKDEGSFHLALPRLILSHLRGRSFGSAVVQLAIMVLWQVSNAAGFFVGHWSRPTSKASGG